MNSDQEDIEIKKMVNRFLFKPLTLILDKNKILDNNHKVYKEFDSKRESNKKKLKEAEKKENNS